MEPETEVALTKAVSILALCKDSQQVIFRLYSADHNVLYLVAYYQFFSGVVGVLKNIFYIPSETKDLFKLFMTLKSNF